MAATPTGCYKCGRVGHWSRDCPSDPKAAAAAPASAGKSHKIPSTAPPPSAGKFHKSPSSAPPPPKQPKSRKRPKLTADLILSDKGLGYVLEKIPHMVSIRGRGHEAHDLGSFLGAYKRWHANLFPSVSFKRFTQEVEDLGTIRRVRVCLEELRNKVANGINLKDCSSQLEQPLQTEPEPEQEEPRGVQRIKPEVVNAEEAEQSLLDEFLEDQQVQRPPPAEPNDEQKARMEANKAKALERARARGEAQLAAAAAAPSD